MQTTLTLPFKVGRVAWSPDGRHIAVIASIYANVRSSKNIHIWDVTQERKPLICRGHQDHVWRVAYSPDGSRLASASEDCTVRVWNPSTGATLAYFQCTWLGRLHPRFLRPRIIALVWSPDGQRLATAGREPLARI
jgi:WD40 repeat protein